MADTIPSQPYKLVWTGFSIHHYDNYSFIDGSLPHNEGYVVTVTDSSITSPLTGYLKIKWTSDSTLIYPTTNPNWSYTVTIHNNWEWMEYKIIEEGKVNYHAKLY